MTFAELVALMVLGSGEPDTITGVVRHESPEDEAWTHRVWRRGDLVRVESLDGEVLRIAGAEHQWVRYQGTDGLTVRPRDERHGSPIGGLEPGGDRPSFSRWDGTDFTRPTGPVTSGEYLGRPTWEVELAPPSHKPYPIHLSVDAATGLVLRRDNPQFGSVTEFTEVAIGADLPDELFDWDGPARPHEEVEAQRDAEHEAELAGRRAWLDARGLVFELPMHPDTTLHDWDDATGAFELSFFNHGSGSLVRRPLGSPAADEQLRYPHAYRWSDSRWEWLLGVDQPIADEQLALLKVQLAKST